MTAPTPRRAAIDDRDFKTVPGLVTEGQRLNEAIADMVSAAYEEVDGLNRPRGSAMGRLLHDVNGKVGQFWTVLELISHRHADELAAVTAERDQARQMLADAWDEGVSFGWHSTELRTDENPYRKAGL